MLSLLLEYRDEAQLALAVLAGLAAFRWGGGPERAIAAVWLVGIEGIDAVYHLLWQVDFQLDRLDVFHAVLDAGVAAALIAIALYANRSYPLWIAAFQLISAMAHLARELTEAISPLAYAMMVTAPSWGILLSLIAGLVAHFYRTQRHGRYRDWRLQSPSPAIG